MTAFSRRSFLQSAAALAAWSTLPGPSYGLLKRFPKLQDYPFACGVASGDPTPTGVVLWTRLAPDPLNGGGMPHEAVEVSWTIADDERMTKVVQKGVAVAEPDLAHSVHVEAEGLKPGRGYYYQFKVGHEISPVGRTRTAPTVGAKTDRLRFAFASCQHYESGLFTAYEHMAKQPLDLVIHLGDYIYEGAGRDRQIRKHVGPEIVTLDHYRNRHAQYKTDEHLQATHLAFPWIVTWDDHEFDNNCAGAISEQSHVSEQEFLERRAAAYQAYYEHMPLRKATFPKGPAMQLYRKLPFGGLVDFHVLDTRQYRSDQPCGDGKKLPCDEALDPSRSLLGEAQEKWLTDGLAASKATWNVLAQQVMFAPVDRDPEEAVKRSMDQWPGYEANRRRLLNFFDEAAVSNPVVITGDIHSNWANDLHLGDAESPVVATEYVGTSISSSGNGSRGEEYAAGMQADNPFVKFFNGERGYVQCELSHDLWQSAYQVVEDVTQPGAPLVTRARFATEAGKPGVQSA
ncbi:MAG: alkaline phosphatase D family protein [Planctomycetaceae bacterium]